MDGITMPSTKKQQNTNTVTVEISSNPDEDISNLLARIDEGRAFIISAPDMPCRQRRAALKDAGHHIEDLIKTGNRENGPAIFHVVILDGAEFQIIE